jgi:DNA-binding NarL/FixJ family response regulator
MQALILRVLVVDDSEIVRRGICQILRSQADIEVVCEAADGAMLSMRFVSTDRMSCYWR